MKKRILAVWLLIFMVISCSGVTFAKETGTQAEAQTEESEFPVSYRGDTEIKIDSISTNTMLRRKSVQALEEAYISPYVTSVKNQGTYGTCWAFSLVAASEASIVKEGLAAEDIDLSEWHVAYFLANSVTDPMGGTRGDKMTINGSYLMEGANQQMATYRVADWYGLVDEKTAPYSAVCSDSSAVLPSSVAYDKDVVHLENAYWVAMKDQNIIKQLIKEYGACGASYHSEDAYYNTSLPYNTEVAEYCPDNVASNHGITIVGWDDSYSRDNFGTEKPESDGAWYCKNSWGGQWGKDGYFWISYEDVPLQNGVGFFYDYGAADNYDHNYQYDGGAWGNYYMNCKYEANIYKAQGYEQLKAVGFYTRNVQYNCTIYIYKNCEEGNPVSGELVAEKTADQLYAGFHTVELDEGIVLNRGDSFSVVICQTTAEGGYVEISVDSTTSRSDSWCVNTSAAEAGQSFISASGTTWRDISAAKEENCRIKAYTDDLTPVTNIKLSHSSINLVRGKSVRLSAVATPQNAYNKELEWISSDMDIAAVSEQGQVTGTAAGSAVITCRAKDGSGVQSTCVVTVLQPVTSITLSASDMALQVGETAMLTAGILPLNASDKSVAWFSSNSQVAVVSDSGVVTAAGIGKAVITCKAKDGSGIMKSCTVAVREKVVSYKKGTILTDSLTRAKYKVVKPEIENATVEYVKSTEAEASLTVPATVKIDGVIYKVTSIRANAFKNNGKLVKVKIGENVTTIGAGAFYGCSKLKNVTLGKNVTSIGNKAFYKCLRLTKITIPSKVKKIGKQAFYNCKKLKNITIKTSKLTRGRIGSKAFKGIHSKAVIKVPKKKLKTYKKILRAKGIGKRVKVKK